MIYTKALKNGIYAALLISSIGYNSATFVVVPDYSHGRLVTITGSDFSDNLRPRCDIR